MVLDLDAFVEAVDAVVHNDGRSRRNSSYRLSERHDSSRYSTGSLPEFDVDEHGQLACKPPAWGGKENAPGAPPAPCAVPLKLRVASGLMAVASAGTLVTSALSRRRSR